MRSHKNLTSFLQAFIELSVQYSYISSTINLVLVMFTSIVQEFKALLSKDSLLKEKKTLDSLIDKFNTLKNESGPEEDVNQLLANDLINELKKKLAVEQESLKKAADLIRSQKEELIEKLGLLIENEQNIGKAFDDLKVIREEWTKLNAKAPLEQKDVDKVFTKKLEDFYYNINIYKAIQEHDLKRNQQIKEAILNKLEAATKKETSKILMTEIKGLKTEWESIGPVSRDLQDDFWDKYRNCLDILYTNFKDFKESEKEEQLENQKKKQYIIDYISAIEISNLKSVKDWKSKGSKVLKKQEEWKTIGFVPKNSKDQLWEDYRTACDAFFNAKKAFFEDQKNLYKANKKLKTELCKKAEELLSQENPQELTRDFVQMQAEWKKIGPVHQRDEQYLWHKFQKACNDFFKQKKTSKRQMEEEKDAVNIEKETLINEAKSLTDNSPDKIIALVSKWWNTNKEHTRKSKQLFKEFSSAIEAQLNGQSFNDFELENLNLKLDLYASFDDGGEMLSREKRFIQDKIEIIKKDITQYENNLSFFGNAKNAEGLMKDVYQKMDLLKKQEANLRTQLSKVSKALKA